MNDVREQAVPVADWLPDVKEVLAEMGYPGGREADPFLGQQVGELMGSLVGKVEPLFAYRIVPAQVDENGGTVWAADACLKTGHVITPLMRGVSAFAIFAATAGEYLARRMAQAAQAHDVLEEYLLSAIGSCVAEKAGDCMEHTLQADIGEWKHTRRFSPGYCGWPLSDQREVFRLLGGEPCGITLSDYCLMSPIKSISGLVGIGREVNQHQYGCALCDLESCYKRKKKKL